ncbi:tRNA (adenosine(37)-N6)-threonylcarbamoyltransferase complex ATPase subunit type 1 TsaE [Anaerobacillus arseniciselenatis]|uniref:tRNA threonylcarbamoyladenosine biosynthesis protein TsaE n=1 Tax=Anaerobacillus arseniciselenatis TaxID=85682 RepID=A0A1S2LX44_9BACI|nr:tRNA (adenosine(37)-N6)-threonylcarbamoyltransferase complex ATPase subunit type 1 TsaE [Anaerobacillus arseniciselenatis]OIJ16227.1 tRNA (adenosine(37)-N6)-threonylcarbamoyltransferase complex ATPase subunit type 1 TsaE [Anaerobacillus arseniciselenatis]
MDNYTIHAASPEETMKFAECLGEAIEAGTVITLEGDLGAGKTHFTKGLAKGLEVKKTVNSPTFTIIKEYKGRLPLYHMDVYRVSGSEEDLGFDEYFYGEGVTVVEWASLIEEQLPNERLAIEIFHEGDHHRKVLLTPHGERYNLLCKELLNK